MKIRLPWRKKIEKTAIMKQEGLLTATLRPVSARREFVTDLREGLVGDGEEMLFGRISPKTLRMGILGIGAALSGAFLILAGLRWVVSLLGALGLIQLSRKNKDKQQTIPVQTTP